MPGIDHDNVEPCLACTQGAFAVPAAIGADIFDIHCAGLDGVVKPRNRTIHRANGNLAAVNVAGIVTIVDQFDGGEAAVLVDGIAHAGQIRHVRIVPQLGLGVMRRIARRVKIALFGGNDTPAAFRLHAAHGDHAIRKEPPHAVAVRYLVEPVLRRHRSDLHGFEQNIVSRIPGHDLSDFSCRSRVRRPAS